MKAHNKSILFGITKSNFGGAQRYVYDLATETKNQSFEISVLVGGEGTLVKKLENAGIKTIPLPSLTRDVSFLDDLKSFIYIYKILKQNKPNVFHINSSKMGGLGTLAARLANINKIIFTLHGFAWKENRSDLEKGVLKFLTWVTILLSTKTICVAERVKTEIENWPFIKNKLAVIHNGVEEFNLIESSEAREKLVSNIQNEEFLVGAVSELHHIKGLDVLLEAWAIFNKDNNSKLVIVGEGEEKQNLENLAESLGISDSVHFLGFIDNARSLLNGLDAYVLPSRSEALPYALLEVGLASLPVIATNVGGVSEIIDDQVSGLLIEPNDPKDLLKALIELKENKELRNKFGLNLNKKIKEQFSKSKMVHATINSYE